MPGDNALAINEFELDPLGEDLDDFDLADLENEFEEAMLFEGEQDFDDYDVDPEVDYNDDLDCQFLARPSPDQESFGQGGGDEDRENEDQEGGEDNDCGDYDADGEVFNQQMAGLEENLVEEEESKGSGGCVSPSSGGSGISEDGVNASSRGVSCFDVSCEDLCRVCELSGLMSGFETTGLEI